MIVHPLLILCQGDWVPRDIYIYIHIQYTHIYIYIYELLLRREPSARVKGLAFRNLIGAEICWSSFRKMRCMSIPRHPVIFSTDDWGVQLPPKRIVFRLPYHSQKVIGSLGYSWFLYRIPLKFRIKIIWQCVFIHWSSHHFFFSIGFNQHTTPPKKNRVFSVSILLSPKKKWHHFIPNTPGLTRWPRVVSTNCVWYKVVPRHPGSTFVSP